MDAQQGLARVVAVLLLINSSVEKYIFSHLVPPVDGENLAAYVLGIFEPIEMFTGKCIAIIHRLNDDDDKLGVTPHEKTYTDDQITALTEFQERFFTSIILR
jgi:inorganic pyrophosphatase